MTKEELKNLVEVIEISPGSENVLLFDNRALSMKDIHDIGKELKRIPNINIGFICRVYGNPHDVVKLVSIDKIKEIK